MPKTEQLPTACIINNLVKSIIGLTMNVEINYPWMGRLSCSFQRWSPLLPCHTFTQGIVFWQYFFTTGKASNGITMPWLNGRLLVWNATWQSRTRYRSTANLPPMHAILLHMLPLKPLEFVSHTPCPSCLGHHHWRQKKNHWLQVHSEGTLEIILKINYYESGFDYFVLRMWRHVAVRYK